MPSLLLLIFLFLGSNDAKKTFNLYKGETHLKMESLQTLELFWHHTKREIWKNGSDLPWENKWLRKPFDDCKICKNSHWKKILGFRNMHEKLKSVHFKITVARSSFCSKLWSFSTEIKTKSADVLLKMIIILNRMRIA